MRPIDVAKKLCPRARRSYLAAIENGDALFERYGITTPLRLAHFFAQAFHETGGLTIEWESGAYSADRLVRIFGVGHHSAAITAAEAQRLSRNASAIFERVYGLGNPRKAKELGNTRPGDGYRYRGGGILQTTGRANYRRMGKKCGVDFEAAPELVLSAEHALKPALAEWGEGNLNRAADRDDILTITKRINGGPNGLEDRKSWLRKLKATIKTVDLETGAQGLMAMPDADDGTPPADADDDAAAPDKPDSPADDGPDPQLVDVQRRLSAMNYSAGMPNGKWGGMTAGAIAGFINDRQMTILAPTSRETFDAVEEDLLAEIVAAEGEGFARPVSEARASADAATVAAVAPEVVPAKRNFLATAWAAVTAFFAALWDSISDHVAAAWNFFTDHRDDIPTDSGFLSTVWGYIAGIPFWVWLLAIAAGLGLLALNARSSVKQITRSVQTGARQ